MSINGIKILILFTIIMALNENNLLNISYLRNLSDTQVILSTFKKGRESDQKYSYLTTCLKEKENVSLIIRNVCCSSVCLSMIRNGSFTRSRYSSMSKQNRRKGKIKMKHLCFSLKLMNLRVE